MALMVQKHIFKYLSFTVKCEKEKKANVNLRALQINAKQKMASTESILGFQTST